MQIHLVKISLCLWAVPALHPRSPLGTNPLGFLQEALEISQHHHASRDPEAGFLARKKLEPTTGAEAAGIADLDGGTPRGGAVDLKGGAHGSPESRARGLHARELLAGLGLLLGAAASGPWARPTARAIAAEPAAKPLLALQVGSALFALVAAVALPHHRAWLLLANAAAHTALLLRGVLGVVEAKHCAAVQQYRRRLVGWSVWLDLRAHSGALAAGVAWSTASLALVLFVLVTLGRAQLFPWAWWASHAVLSVAVLALAASGGERHPAQAPVLLLAVNCVVGCAYGGPFSPPAEVVLLVVPLLQLLEAAGSARCLGENDAAGADAGARYDCADATQRSVERQLLATLAGNQDSLDFEQHLATERRLCELYCAQDLLHCESAPSGPELLDRYRTWVAQFATERAPLAVRQLPDGLDLAVQRVELCPQASVHRAKQALLGMLRAPYARFLAQKRRQHLSSAGRLTGETKPLPRWTLRRLLGFDPPASTTVV